MPRKHEGNITCGLWSSRLSAWLFAEWVFLSGSAASEEPYLLQVGGERREAGSRGPGWVTDGVRLKGFFDL